MNATCTDDGLTALMIASREGRLLVAKALLDSGASKTVASAVGSIAQDYAAGPALYGLLNP